LDHQSKVAQGQSAFDKRISAHCRQMCGGDMSTDPLEEVLGRVLLIPTPEGFRS